MFNLEQSVNEWRRKMAASGIRTSKVLDELESHLREIIESELHSGLEPAAAFKIAVQRIGQAKALRTEFAKLDANRHHLLPKIFRISCFITGPLTLIIGGWTLLDSFNASFGPAV